MLDALRDHDDPGIAHPERLVASEAIDLPLRRHRARILRQMRIVNVVFWTAMAFALGVAVVVWRALS